jgi:hypothetical protein
MGKNCWQFFTVDRSHFCIIPERWGRRERAEIGCGEDESGKASAREQIGGGERAVDRREDETTGRAYGLPVTSTEGRKGCKGRKP